MEVLRATGLCAAAENMHIRREFAHFRPGEEREQRLRQLAAREIGRKLSESWGQQVVVDHHPEGEPTGEAHAHRADPRPQVGDARDGYVATATVIAAIIYAVLDASVRDLDDALVA